MPAVNFDPRQWEVVSDPNYGFDPSQWEVVQDLPLYDPIPETPSVPLNYERESKGALLLRQQAQREAEQQPDESTLMDRASLGVGQGWYGLESGLGGLFNLIGLTSAGRALQQNARAGAADLSDVSATLAGQNPNLAREYLETFGGMATQQVPAAVAGFLTRSPTVAAILAGGQSAGQTQDTAEQAYEIQGMSPDEATARARIPAIASGALTGLLTRFMPGHLGEGIAGRGSIISEMLKEVPEEVLDQLGQSLIARMSYDPEKPLDEALLEAWEAGGWGAGTALGVGALGKAVNAISRATSARIPEPQTGVSLRSPAGAQPPVAQPVTQADIDEANRVNSIAQLTREAQERLRQEAATFNPNEMELVSEPLTVEPQSGPPFTIEETRRRLTEGMQTRSMDLSPADFQTAEPTIQAMLGPQAPSWQQLAEAGVVQATPNPNGTVNVRVAPNLSEIPNSSTVAENTTVQPETSQPIPETIPSVSETIAPPVAANLATTETAPTGKPDLQVRPSAPTYERPPDIVDWVADNGKFRRIKPGEQSPVADLWRAAQKARPELFHVSGSAPDVVAENYRRTTGKDLADDEFLQEIIETGSRRKKQKDDFFRQVRFANQDAQFQKNLIANEGPGKSKTRPAYSDELEKGQTFRGRGEKFTVTKSQFDSIQVTDGPKFGTQTIPSGTVLHIDKGSLRTPKVSSTNPPQGAVGETSQAGSQSPETPRKAQGSQDTPPPEAVKQSALVAPAPAQLRSEKARAVAQAANEWAAQHGIPFQLVITSAVDQSGGVTEMGARIGNVIEAAENADEKVLPHELMHIVWDGLPAETKAIVEAARRSALPPNVDPRIEAGNMTSAEFKESGLPLELYPLSNASEYLAHFFQDPFAKQAITKADPSLLGQLRIWVAGIWRTIKRALGLGNQMDRVVQDLIDGRLKFDPAIAAQQESKVRQSTFVTTAQESRNAAELADTAPLQQIEGESQLAQAADVTDVLDQFGVNTKGHLVQKAFDYSNWQAIRNTGEALNQSRETYRQMKARLAADPYRRARLAGEAGQSQVRFDEILDQVRADADKAFQKLTSRHFQDFKARVQAKAAEDQAARAILQTSKATFDSAIKEASKALKEEARTDRDMAVLQGEIRGIKEAAESTVAMEQTINDMVTVLSSTPEGQAALFTGQGGGRGIIEIYRDIKRSTRQPVTNENLLKWAGYILAKNPKLAAKVQTANLAKQTGLRAQLNGMAKQLADDFSKDPVATVRRSMRDRERKVRNAMSAEFAFKQIEEDFLSEFEPLVAAVDAGGIAAQIKADPAFQSLRREILNDQGSFGGSPEPAKAMRSKDDAASTLTMPIVPGHPMSGATVGIGHDSIGDGSTASIRKVWDEQRQAKEFLEDWLANPLNADDPMRRYHAHNLDQLTHYYAGQQHLMPENQSPLWNRAYSMVGSAVNKSGSRLAGQARSVLNRADQMHKWARDWFDRQVHALPMTQRAAITSHGIKWNNLRGQSIVQANRIYQQRVGQELAASWARQQGGYNVGDTLSSGEVVTREDIAHLEAQAKAGFEALNLAAKYDEQITKDARGLKKDANGNTLRPNYRSALRTSPYLLPRMFDYALQSKAKALADAFKAEPGGAPRPGTEAALNQIWPDIGLSLLTDRNPEFAKRTIFDGKGNGFDNAANMIRQNPNSIPDIDTLANELASSSTMTPAEAKEIVLGEFGRIVSKWSTAVEEKVAAAEGGDKSGDAKNSFTQARGDALAPWTFYKTGFTTTDDISNHAAGMQSVALDRVTATLEAIQKDLERQENDLSTKAKELERIGKPNSIKTAQQLKEIERRRGLTFDSWENLKDRKANIEGVLKNLQNPAVSSTDFDTLFNRGTGALVGSLIGNGLNMVKNLSSIFLGRQLRAAGMDELNSTLRSALFTKAEAAKILASFGFVGVPKSMGYMLRGLARGVPQLLKGNAREAYVSALRDVIRELSVNVPRRLKSVRDMEAAGVYHLPDKVAQFDNQILGSILYKGGIPANEFQGAAKVGGYAAGLFESTLLALTTAPFPTIGDAAINGAMHNAVNSRWGPVQGMEDSLRKLYANWQNGGLPRTFNLNDPADPVNRLSPKELGLNEHTLSQVRRTYEMAGMSFDERAATFLRDLQNNPQSQFLTTENRNALTDTLINKMNRGSFSNAPLKFKDGSFLSNFVRPLYGWNVRSFADFEQSMAVPTNTETGRMKLWAASMMLTAVALAMTGAGGQLQDELMARIYRRGLYSQESQNRLPWEEQSLGRGAAGWTRLAMESVPLLGILGNLLIPANTPARASFEPTLVLWESAKSIAGWIHGMIASGDPMYGLPDLMAKFVPDSKIVLNRLESQEGRRLGANAVADIKRFADPDLVRPSYRGAVASGITEATPWKQRMDNAAYRGDRVAFRQAAQEAVQANIRMGKRPADARKAVQSYWRSRNPETRALTRRMTPDEQRAMVERAAGVGVDLSQEIRRANQLWAQAGAMIGVRQRQGGGTNGVSLRAPSLSAGRGMARY